MTSFGKAARKRQEANEPIPRSLLPAVVRLNAPAPGCASHGRDDMTARIQEARGSTARNLLVRFAVYIAAAGLNILVMPFVLRGVGVEAYGIAGVMNSVVAIVGVGTIAISGAVGRETIRAFGGSGKPGPADVVGTAVSAVCIVLACLSVPGLLLALCLQHVFVVPDALLGDARLFVLLVLGSAGASAIAGPLGAIAFARNRVDLLSIAAFGRTAAAAGFVVLAFTLVGPSLSLYGVTILAAALVHLGLTFVFAKKLLPGERLLGVRPQKAALSGLLSLGGWMIVTQIGVLLFVQMDLVVANRVLGPTKAGELAGLALIPLQLRAVAGMLSEVFSPSQMALALPGSRQAFAAYLIRSVRSTSLLMALLVGVFCGGAGPILEVWLGRGFGALAPVAITMTAYLVPALGLMPCWNALVAVGEVRGPALVTVGMGLLNVVLGVLLAGPVGLGLMGIAIAGGIALGLRNLVWAPWYVSAKCGVSGRALGAELVRGGSAGVAVFLVARLVFEALRAASPPAVGGALLISGVVGTVIVALLGGDAVREAVGRLRAAVLPKTTG